MNVWRRKNTTSSHYTFWNGDKDGLKQLLVPPSMPSKKGIFLHTSVTTVERKSVSFIQLHCSTWKWGRPLTRSFLHTLKQRDLVQLSRELWISCFSTPRTGSCLTEKISSIRNGLTRQGRLLYVEEGSTEFQKGTEFFPTSRFQQPLSFWNNWVTYCIVSL